MKNVNIKINNNLFLFIFILCILSLIFILIYSVIDLIKNKTYKESYSNIAQVIIDTHKNKNLKVISTNLPLSIRQKCNLMRKQYPNLKVCIIKKKN